MWGKPIKEVSYGTLKIYSEKIDPQEKEEIFRDYCEKNNLEKINLIISGNLESIPANFLRNCGNIDNLIIEQGVQEIGASAFAYNKILRVKFPNSLKKIGMNAFIGNRLTEIDFPDGLEEIGASAFADNELSKIKLPQRLKIISKWSFYKNRLTEIEIPEKVEEIGISAFAYNKISKIKFPQKLKIIHRESFAQNQLTEMELPEGIVKIGERAFENNRLSRIKFLGRIYGNKSPKNQLTNIVIPISTFVSLNVYDVYDKIEELIIIGGNNDYMNYYKEIIYDSFPNVKKINFVDLKIDLYGDIDVIDMFNSKIEVNVQSVSLSIDSLSNRFKLPQEAIELINQINGVIKKLSYNEIIKLKIQLKEIMTKYEENILKNRPQFNLNETPSVSLETGDNGLKNIQLQLIIALKSIINNINNQKKFIEDLEKIKIYKNVLNGLEIPNNEASNKIQEILKISKILNINLYNNMNDLLNKAEQNISSMIKVDLSVTLVTTDYMQELENKIIKLYDKYNKIYIKVQPYFQIINDVKNDQFIELKDIQLVINKLDDKNRDKYVKKIEKLKNNFISIIYESIENIKNNKETKTIKEIEIEFRNELTPFLETLKQDYYEYEKNGKLLYELEQCLKFIQGEDAKEVSGAVYETVIEINKLSKKLKISEADKVNIEINKIISKWLKIVKENNYKELTEKYKEERLDSKLYNPILIVNVMILKELFDIKSYICSYLEEEKEYDSLKK